MASEKELGMIAAKLLGPWLDALTDRNAKNASRTAGKLMFWRDGMLGDLEKIASGVHDAKTIASLKRKFADSAPTVKNAIQQLHTLRGKLAPSKISEQIDLVLHHNAFGKGSIRDSIQAVLWDFESGGNQEGTAEFASKICSQIRTLNAELQKLGRMVCR